LFEICASFETASFFLTRSGERAYILEQLNAHFGDRYTVSDEFLDVYVKVRDLADTDRRGLPSGFENTSGHSGVCCFGIYAEATDPSISTYPDRPNFYRRLHY
jgi:hypothetical protein